MRKAKFILPLTAFMLIASCGCGKPSVTESSSDPKDVSEEPADASQEPSQEPAKFTRYNKDLVFHSDILDTDLKYSVYLPEGYEQNSTERYPVVYMLHGYGDDNNSWNGDWLHAADRIKALEGGGMREMIYVFPYGYQGYYVNKYDGSFNYMDMFAEEFIPHIDASFRTLADKGHRSITGYSMGGFGAYVLAAKHPELFLCSAPLSMSFRTDRQYMTEGSGRRSQWGSLFGGKDEKGEGRLTDYYKQHCPYYVFNDANRESLETVKWYFTCGDDEEQLLIAGDSLHVVMRDRAFKHEYRVGNGGHTSTYWMTALTEVLPMFAYYLRTFFATSLKLLPRLYLPLLMLVLADAVIAAVLVRKKKYLQIFMTVFTQFVMIGMVSGIPLLMEEIHFYPRIVFPLYLILAGSAMLALITAREDADHVFRGWKIVAGFSVLFFLIQGFFVTQIAENHYISNQLDLTYTAMVQQKIRKYEAETGIRVEKVATARDEVSTRYYDGIYYTFDQINERVLGMSTFSLLRYTSDAEHDFQLIDMDEDVFKKYFEGRDWVEFDVDEQVVIEGDTLYWCAF